MRRSGKCVEHQVWSFAYCFVALSVMSFQQGFSPISLKEADHSVDVFPPHLNRCMEVIHHRSSFVSDRTDHSHFESVLVVSVRWAPYI